MLFYLIYTFFVGLLWYFFVQDIGYLGYWGLFFSLVLTFYSAFFIRFARLETKLFMLIKFAVPVAFLLYTFATMSYSSTLTVFNPIIFAFVLLSASLASSQKIPPTHYQFFAVFFSYLYASVVYDKIWQQPVLGTEARALQVGIPPQKDKTKDKKEQLVYLDLAHFRFVNSSQDTISIDPQGKYVIIETWNEKCPPCMKAIPEMIVFYEEIQTHANHYYLYIPNLAKNTSLDINKVFSFHKIKTKDKILIDQSLQKDLNLDSYPVFILFDKDGKQVFQHIGYDKEAIVSAMKAIIFK
jgi:thiol-disulfide isomerase/thioredoxin